jgi:hypothetical protein
VGLGHHWPPRRWARLAGTVLLAQCHASRGEVKNTMATMFPDDPSQARGRHRVATEPKPLVTAARPHVWEFVLHPLKALRFAWALARDPRVPLAGKALYLLVVGVLLIALLVPEGLVAAVVATLLPVLGPLIAVPADITVDWLLVGTVAYALLGLFPAHIVREYHARIFHPRRGRRL